MDDDSLEVRSDGGRERRDVARRHRIRQFEQRAQVFAFSLQLTLVHSRLLGTVRTELKANIVAQRPAPASAKFSPRRRPGNL